MRVLLSSVFKRQGWRFLENGCSPGRLWRALAHTGRFTTKPVSRTRVSRIIRLPVVLLFQASLFQTGLFAALPPAFAYRDDPQCHAQKLGWHFYCDDTSVTDTRVKPETVVPAAPQGRPELSPTPVSPTPDPRARIKAIGERLEHLKAIAILEPSEANIKAYIAYQSEQMDRAALFSDQWRRVLWQNPGLDYALFRPTGTLAKRAWLDERKHLINRTLASLNRRYGVFWFFKGNECAPCTTAAPILADFATTHNVHVMAVSLDGTGVPAFPDFVTDTGQAKRLGIDPKFLPALALYDSQKREVIPVGFGVMAADALATRIYALTRLKPGEDY